MSETSAAAFARRYPFELDEFQRDAIEVLAGGASVMVAAPTGIGKTVVAEFAVYRAHERRRRAFYTTPIKALSNQKYRDFRAQYGDAVGLMTGDVVENPGGSILVMTTEVVRNMLLQRPEELHDVDCIVFDEVHFLSDPIRGTTWEEAIICAPRHVQLVCLSATVSNAGQVADWISEVHRPIKLILHRRRSVPLEHSYYLDGELIEMIDERGRPTADLRGIGGELRRGIRTRGMNFTRNRRGDGRAEPTPAEVVRMLGNASLLPALYFFFSRRDCERAAETCAFLGLARGPAQTEIRRRIDEKLAVLTESDRQLNQVVSLRRLLPLGVGFHHAGLLPVLKILVEELFNKGLLQVVFATDTLSLGINMPAKTVVIGELTKFDGEQRRPLTPNEYQQLTGRAGRRGIDTRGVAVVPYSPWVAAEEVIEIATGDLLPIESAFTLRYNTVLNLWDPGPRPTERLSKLVASSLREFQLDDELKALHEEMAALQHELRTTLKAELAKPAHGHDARRLRGNRWANHYTVGDLLRDRFAELEQESLRVRQARRSRARQTLRSLERILEGLRFIEDGRPTRKAAALRELFDANGLILVEALTRGVFRDADAADLVEVFSWFCYDRDKAFYNHFRLAPELWDIRERIERIQDEVLRAEAENGLTLTPGFSLAFSGIAHAWCRGAAFDELLAGASLPEGDIMQTFSKTLDLMRQMRDGARALERQEEFLKKLEEGDRLMRRGIVALCCSVGLPAPAPAGPENTVLDSASV
ncbi:MAG TPA: DEAD/DEAH box helicase [Chloroflexota bacterium]